MPQPDNLGPILRFGLKPWHTDSVGQQEPSEIENRLAGMLTAVKSIREVRMRQAAMAQILGRHSALETVQTIQALIAKAGRGNLEVSLALSALVAVLEHPDHIHYDDRVDLYSAANELRATEVSYILLEGTRDEAEAPEDAPRPVTPNGPPLPLGARKSAARTRDRTVLTHLMHDPNMQVVEVLLNNPNLMEPDLLIMAAKRPADRRSLQRIANHPRWSQSRRVRLALALNPDCPLPLACRLCLDFRDSDLREVARNAGSPPLLRGHATRLLRRRV
ncbi:MAG: hypothetical protein GY811_22590 [Myxococcales bacterium]|nr:hypothetical protein [Myxococcales bacterium]